MLNKIKQIMQNEFKILTLQKQIRTLETNGGDLEALLELKTELLQQLRINLEYGFGFNDMKQLAINELSSELKA